MKVCLAEHWKGGKHILIKNRGWDYLHGKTFLKGHGLWTLLEVAERERDQALGQHRAFALWVLIRSFNQHQAWGSTELCAYLGCILGRAGCWAAPCAAPSPSLGYQCCLSHLLSAFQIGEKQKQHPSFISTWGPHGGEASCRVILHPPRQPLPSWGFIWSHIDPLIPWFQLKLHYCEALSLSMLWCIRQGSASTVLGAVQA